MSTTTTPSTIESLRADLVDPTEAPSPSAWSASLSFGWRALRKLRHDPQQLFDITGFPVLFTLLFSYLFGGAVAGSTTDYVQSFLPAVAVFTVAMSTMHTGVTLNTDMAQGISDRFRSLPLWRPAVVVGTLLGNTVHYLIATVVVVTLGLAIGFRPHGGIVGVVLATVIIVAFAFSLSWVFTALGLVLRDPGAVMNTSTMVLFPVVFASNFFVPPETMPSWLRAVADVNPFSLVVTAVRGMMHGTITSGQTFAALAACAAITAVFAPLTMRLYRAER